jgi:transposase-like protein
VKWIGLMIAIGVLGLWKAQLDFFPLAGRHRCWVHKMRDVLDKIPLRAHKEALLASREMCLARSKDQAVSLMRAFLTHFGNDYP